MRQAQFPALFLGHSGHRLCENMAQLLSCIDRQNLETYSSVLNSSQISEQVDTAQSSRLTSIRTSLAMVATPFQVDKPHMIPFDEYAEE